MPYSERHQHPIGVSNRGFGGAGLNLASEALAGETELTTTFEDFNWSVRTATLNVSAGLGHSGYVLTDVGTPVADGISVNDIASGSFNSCLKLAAGTTADTGMQVAADPVNHSSPQTTQDSETPVATYCWYPSNSVASAMDGRSYVFAARVGINSQLTTDFDGKIFIGLAEAGDTSLMTVGTGALTTTADGPLVGFHINGDSQNEIRGVSTRGAATAFTDGTNQTIIYDDSGARDVTPWNTLSAANVPNWFDLAFRVDVNDMSDDNANGATTFYTRRVTPATSGAAGATHDRTHPWVKAGSLLNQTPNNDTICNFTIEVINGPAGRAEVLLDWVATGISRFSRSSLTA